MGVKTIISSPIEHNAVLNVLDLLETEGVNIKYVKLDKHGEVDLSDLEQILKSHEGVKLVSLMYINNEIGNLLDIDEVARICKLHNSFFHTRDLFERVNSFMGFNCSFDGILFQH